MTAVADSWSLAWDKVRPDGNSVTLPADYPNAHLAKLMDQIENARAEGLPTPNAASRGRARKVLLWLVREGLHPSRVVPSGDGGVAFIFSKDGKYADIECLNDGSTLVGLMDYKELNEVVELSNLDGEEALACCSRLKRFIG